MKVVRLQAENFKRLKAVEIIPVDDNSVIISGPNGSGKTSILDAIALAVAGKKYARDLTEPIRQGESRASVTVETDTGLAITRTWTKNGTPGTLTVKSIKDKTSYNSPQAFLDNLIGELSFDPLAFANAKPQEQRAILMNVVGLGDELDNMDAERKRIFDERTEVNRRVKELTVKVSATEEPAPNLPEEEISATDLFAKYQAASESIAQYTDVAGRIEQQEQKLKDLEAQIISIKAGLVDLREWEAAFVSPDIDAMKDEISRVDQTNQSIRDAAKYKEAKALLARATYEADQLTKKIDAIDAKKSKLLADAKFPIDGLGFADDGIKLNDVPFCQCSMSEKIKTSTAMAMAQNPEFRVIRIKDASLLDAENLEAIQSQAKDHDFQIWYEMVSSGDGVGFCVEDGEIQTCEKEV